MKLNVRIPIAASRKISVAIGTGVIFLVIIELLMTRQILPYTNDMEVFVFILTVLIAYGIGSWVLLGYTREISKEFRAKASNVTYAITNASTPNIVEKETPNMMIQTLIEKLQAAVATVGTTNYCRKQAQIKFIIYQSKVRINLRKWGGCMDTCV